MKNKECNRIGGHLKENCCCLTKTCDLDKPENKRKLEVIEAHGAESGCPVEMCQKCFEIDNK